MIKHLGRWAAALCCGIAALSVTSVATAQTGVCCTGTTCTTTTTGGCIVAGQVFIAGVSSCTGTNFCGGACCTTTGTCSLTVGTSCTGTNTYLGLGTVCSPVPCTPYLGACCAPNGTCTSVTFSGCTIGTFAGVGITCASAGCTNSFTGVCCGVNGACATTSATGCAYPSIYTAGSTVCSPSTCLPSPLLTGACCSADGNTCSIRSTYTCALAGLSIVGATPGAGAATVTTVLPHSLVTGNSVTIAGSSVGGFNGTFSVTVLDGTHFYISTTTTGTGTGPITIAPSFSTSLAVSTPAAGSVTATVAAGHPFVVGTSVTIAGATPTGLNGTFTVAAATGTTFTFANATTGTVTGTITAAAFGETYLGNNTTCSSVPSCSASAGACCTTAGVCSLRTVTACGATSSNSFQGAGTTCASAPCVTGACCGVSGTCTATTAAGCGLSSGSGVTTFLGNGVACSGTGSTFCFTQLGSGACCPNGSTACALTTPAGCGTAQFATYNGTGTTCATTTVGTDAPCNALRGACCSTAGICSVTVVLACNGSFNGVGTVCTTSNICTGRTGACCSNVGGCFVASNAGGNGCTGTSSFLGAGTTCTTTDPCPALKGRCCTTNGGCLVTIQSGCTSPNTWTSVVGASASCSSNPCPALLGACCSNLGICTQTLAAGCTGSSTFTSAGTTCAASGCSPSSATSGACCDLNGGSCTQTSQIACVGTNVLWSAGSSCNPNNAACSTLPAGACCIGTFCTAGTAPGFCNLVGGAFFFSNTCTPTPCVRPKVVISQLYPGGGTTGCIYKNDYVELYNYDTVPVNITGWSLQFGAQSTQTFPSRVILSGTIQPGSYHLIQLASTNGALGAYLPTPDEDFTGINLDVTAGRLALVSSGAALNNGCPSPFPVNIVDFVGYGAAVGSSNVPTCSEGGSPAGGLGGNVYAYFRKGNGCQDTDNNGADFLQPLFPMPRNSATAVYTCGTTAQGACCVNGICSLGTAASCFVGFAGEGTSCSPQPASPNYPCDAPVGACCTASGSCTAVVQGACTSTSTYLFGRLCAPDPCNAACCTGTTCTFTSIAACVSPAYFLTGVATCSPLPCVSPAIVRSGDIAYGASVSQNQDAVQQIRSAGVANPVRVGTWSKYDSQQSMRFDNSGGVFHNAAGNLLGLNFGSTAAGGSIYNFPTTSGDATAGSTLFFFNSATTGQSPGGPTLTLGRTRFAGMSVSPSNDRVAVIGYDQARLMVFAYDPGAAVGTGSGASFTAAAQTDNSTFFFGFNITQGTAWLDNDHVLMWVLSDIASVLKLYSIPVSGNSNAITLGTPTSVLAIADNKPNSSRFTSIAYNPQLIPGYIFLGGSAFQGVSLNTVYVVRTSDWSVAKTIDLGTSLQTLRELAIGPDRNLYISEFAGTGQQATDPLIDRIVLDANGDGVVTETEIAALTDNSSVDFYLKGSANTATFNGLDIAVSLGACCVTATTCSIQPPNFCTGGHGSYLGDNTTCSPTTCNGGICCRGATCTTIYADASTCAAALSTTSSSVVSKFVASGSTCNSPTTTPGSLGNTTTPCCYANYNHNATLEVQDIFDFLNDWFAGKKAALVGGDGDTGTLSIANIFDFLNAWFAGGCN